MNDIIKNRIVTWTKSPFDQKTIDEIKLLQIENKTDELSDRFYKMLEFGTGGLRGILGSGTNRMNRYTVGMATQGLANYIIQSGLQEKGVVIARDSRRMSDEFSIETAEILAGNGIKVYLFKDITPTPFASFAIRELGAGAGIVITASHNPREYNGYKVYWEDGGQIVSPHDGLIIKEVEKIDSIEKIKKIEYNQGIKQSLIQVIDEDITEKYISNLESATLSSNNKSNISIAYTPIHGTGYKIVPKVLKHFGFSKIISVTEQNSPDGEFPTVEYPNPEEKETMELALKYGKENGADLIFATDPDADRVGIGIKSKSGEYKLLNGNQIGTLLEYYILTRYAEKNRLDNKSTVVKTIVTTELQREVAEGFNCKIEDVLTGFKWIASKMKEFDETKENNFIFGGEESYGYLPVNFVRDKDAVSSIYFFAEMAEWLVGQKRTIEDLLLEIYIKHSLYLEDLHTLTLKGMDGSDKIKSIMNEFRNNPPKEFNDISIEKIADFLDPESKTGNLPSSNVLQFFLSDGSKITMRPSGTEPKIKFYFSVKEKVSAEDIEEKELVLKNKISDYKKSLLQKIDKIIN